MGNQGGDWDARLRPGELSRAETKDLREVLGRMLRVDSFRGGGELVQAGPSGLRSSQLAPDGFWAIIDSGANPYTWHRVVPAASGVSQTDTVHFSGSSGGENPAYAANGETTVAAGTLVWMTPWFLSSGADGQNYIFLVNAAATAATAYPTNALMNGEFIVHQRDKNGLAFDVANLGYAHDHWRVLSQTASIRVSVSAGSYTQNQAAAQRFGICQVVDNAASAFDSLDGTGLTFSIRLTGTLGGNVRMAILSATTGNLNLVNSWTSATYTPGNFFNAAATVVGVSGSLPFVNGGIYSLTVNSFSAANFYYVFVWTESAEAQNNNITPYNAGLWNINEVPTAYPFPDFATELLRCQRFAISWQTDGTHTPLIVGQGFAISTSNVNIVINLPIQLNAVPTVTSTIGNLRLSDGVNNLTPSAVTVVESTPDPVNSQVAGPKTVELQFTVPGNAVQFRPYKLVMNSIDDLLLLDAEY